MTIDIVTAKSAWQDVCSLQLWSAYTASRSPEQAGQSRQASQVHFFFHLYSSDAHIGLHSVEPLKVEYVADHYEHVSLIDSTNHSQSQ